VGIVVVVVTDVLLVVAGVVDAGRKSGVSVVLLVAGPTVEAPDVGKISVEVMNVSVEVTGDGADEVPAAASLSVVVIGASSGVDVGRAVEVAGARSSPAGSGTR